MGRTIMNVAAVSLDGFIADDHDGIEPLFDWLGNGDVTWRFPGTERDLRTTRASADFMLGHYRDVAAAVIGRRLFDLTNGWGGKIETAGEHVFVVTHRPPTGWAHADTAPFTFVNSVERAIAAARAFAGDRDVNVFSGQIGGQALALGLIDQIVINLVPGGPRLRPPVLRHRRPGRAAAAGEPDHDRARRPGHPPGLRRRPLRPWSLGPAGGDPDWLKHRR